MGTLIAIVLAAVGLSLSGCAGTSQARAEQVRKTGDGGTIQLIPGLEFSGAAKAALKAMAAHCQGEFAVTEMTRAGTGAVVSEAAASGYSAYGATFASGSSVSQQQFGPSYTYACRKPGLKDLNANLIEIAFAGDECRTASDCGGFKCGRPVPDDSVTRCARADGTYPFAERGQDCTARQCAPGLTCSFNGPGKYCR